VPVSARPGRPVYHCVHACHFSSLAAQNGGSSWSFVRRNSDRLFFDCCSLAISEKNPGNNLRDHGSAGVGVSSFGWSLLWLEALPDLYNTLCSFDPRQVRARRKIARYQGRIDLVFGGENHDHITGKGQIRDRVQVGFLGLENADEIDRLLERHFTVMDGGEPSKG
jgi:hypothetical protein